MTAIPVGICGCHSAAEAGLIEGLSPFGFRLERVVDLGSWLSGRSSPLLVFVVGPDAGLAELAGVCRGTVRVVALLESRADESRADALAVAVLRAGALSYVSVGDDSEHMAMALDAASRGCSLLSRALKDSIVRGGPAGALDELEIDWLQGIAAGSTVLAVAYGAGFSEREMYRRLRRIYDKLGAANRREALAVAGRLRLIRRV